jgi:hypothetical protein
LCSTHRRPLSIQLHTIIRRPPVIRLSPATSRPPTLYAVSISLSTLASSMPQLIHESQLSQHHFSMQHCPRHPPAHPTHPHPYQACTIHARLCLPFSWHVRFSVPSSDLLSRSCSSFSQTIRSAAGPCMPRPPRLLSL